MFFIKIKLLVFVFCCIINSQGLERLALEEDNILIVTESVIRNTINELFLGLHLEGIQTNPRLKEPSLVHKFLVSVTLKEHTTLNKIDRLTSTDKNKVNNETEVFMTILNEILNEEWNGDDVDSLSYNEDVIEYVDEFLSNLEGFKENSYINNSYESLDIKDEIIHILQSDNTHNLNISQPQVNLTAEKLEDALLSDNEFWVPEQESRRIFRGERTKIKYFPFMASVQIFNNFQCGGSIIKSDLVVTAASCLQLAWNNRFFRENPAFLSVRVGSNFYNGGGESIPILEVYFHPEYNPRNLRHNIAVMRLLRHLKFRKHKRRLKKIDIDRIETQLPMTTDGITIVGWGAKGPSNIVRDPWSNQLAFAVLDVYHLQECQEIYSKEYVTRSNFCAGFVSRGGGACNHDVGGPGVVNGILTGIVSFGSPVCGTPDAPTVFTKVGFYADWIEELMEQDVPNIRRKTTLLDKRPIFPPTHDYSRATTFKLPPIGGKTMKPIPLNEMNSLRILEDENLFKEFLATMFNSKEAIKYKDLLSDTSMDKNVIEIKEDAPERHGDKTEVSVERPEEKEKIEMYNDGRLSDEDRSLSDEGELESVTENISDGTKMDDYESASKKPVRTFTVLEKDLMGDGNDGDSDDNDNDNVKDNDNSIESNIVKLIDNIPSDTDDESLSIGTEREINQQVTKKPKQKRKKNNIKKIGNDPVLTLLYLSDEIEKNNSSFNGIEDFDENVSVGMPISPDGFKDLTFRHINKSNSVLDFLSKTELYDLLTEAIDDVTKNKTS